MEIVVYCTRLFLVWFWFSSIPFHQCPQQRSFGSVNVQEFAKVGFKAVVTRALLDLLDLLQVFCGLVLFVASWLHGSLPEVQK